MRNIIVVAVSLSALLVFGCQSQERRDESSQNRKDKEGEAASASPLELLKQIARKGHEQAKSGVRHDDYTYYVPDTRVEVKETGSIVKPYAGRLGIDSEHTDPETGETIKRYFVIYYFFENDEWIAQWASDGPRNWYAAEWKWKDAEAPDYAIGNSYGRIDNPVCQLFTDKQRER